MEPKIPFLRWYPRCYNKIIENQFFGVDLTRMYLFNLLTCFILLLADHFLLYETHYQGNLAMQTISSFVKLIYIAHSVVRLKAGMYLHQENDSSVHYEVYCWLKYYILIFHQNYIIYFVFYYITKDNMTKQYCLSQLSN